MIDFMSFDCNKPVYLQIVDNILMGILNRELKSNDKMISVREYGIKLGVNPNTIMRSYEYLTNQGIIYNKRGIGYFISDNAFDIVFNIHKKHFIEEEIPNIKQKMKLFNLDYSIFNE